MGGKRLDSNRVSQLLRPAPLSTLKFYRGLFYRKKYISTFQIRMSCNKKMTIELCVTLLRSNKSFRLKKIFVLSRWMSSFFRMKRTFHEQFNDLSAKLFPASSHATQLQLVHKTRDRHTFYSFFDAILLASIVYPEQ